MVGGGLLTSQLLSILWPSSRIADASKAGADHRGSVPTVRYCGSGWRVLFSDDMRGTTGSARCLDETRGGLWTRPGVREAGGRRRENEDERCRRYNGGNALVLDAPPPREDKIGSLLVPCTENAWKIEYTDGMTVTDCDMRKSSHWPSEHYRD